jgi:hypothetical protein
MQLDVIDRAGALDATATPSRGTARDPGGRYDIYRLAHKGLRAAMCDALLRVGRLDEADEAELSDTLARVRGLLAICRSHLEHENNFVHRAMETRRPGACARIAGEHVEHLADIARLESAAREIDSAPGSQRHAAASRLYDALARFVGHNFEHMYIEETDHNSILWENFSEEEVVEIHHAIVSSIPPDKMGTFLPWVTASVTPLERANMLKGMQRSAPTQVFDGLLQIIRPHLSDRQWHKLMAALTS